ncbi:MAG TPA: uroporphyrinogen decarboxylase family protein [Candidatus Latescibacteria bacterium]|nr:uroporphyrinogen decarboxylase family protein [Candidatus Latescibacterota bacterium]
MTSRERLRAIFAHEPYDHFGIFEHFWSETIPEWRKQGFPEDGDPARFFDYDLRGVGGGPNATPFRDFSELIQETDEWKVTRSGWGAALKHWKHHSGTPEHIDFLIKDATTWRPYRDQLVGPADPTRLDIDGTRKNWKEAAAEEKYCTFSCLFIVETLRHALGDVHMLESFILDKPWLHDVNRVITDFYIRHFDLLFEEVGVPDGIFIYEDLGFTNGLFASPKTLEELIFPYYREFVDFFKGKGAQVLLHSCGGVTEAVPMILEAGFDCLQPMEAKAGVDVVALARKFGNRIAFMGNIDVTKLNTNDRAIVKAEVLGKLNALYDLGAGYVFHSDHSIPPDVTFDTYRYAVDLYRDFCATHPCGA